MSRVDKFNLLWVRISGLSKCEGAFNSGRLSSKLNNESMQGTPLPCCLPATFRFRQVSISSISLALQLAVCSSHQILLPDVHYRSQCRSRGDMNCTQKSDGGYSRPFQGVLCSDTGESSSFYATEANGLEFEISDSMMMTTLLLPARVREQKRPCSR